MTDDASIVLSVEVHAPQHAVFAAAVDWVGHDRWMLLTSVEPTRGAGDAEGDELRAVTGPRVGCRRRPGRGAARVGLVDTMRIELWDPPRRAVVRHTGRVVRGVGEFAVAPRSDGTSIFVWSERLSLPLGPLGRLAWPLIRPAARAALGFSLRRFAQWAPRATDGPRWSG
jgi:hypothetical protein